MSKIRTVLSHLTVIISLMLVVFLILDQFNPMMNFMDNTVSRCLLAALCAIGIIQSILYWKTPRRSDTDDREEDDGTGGPACRMPEE